MGGIVDPRSCWHAWGMVTCSFLWRRVGSVVLSSWGALPQMPPMALMLWLSGLGCLLSDWPWEALAEWPVGPTMQEVRTPEPGLPLLHQCQLLIGRSQELGSIS